MIDYTVCSFSSAPENARILLLPDDIVTREMGSSSAGLSIKEMCSSTRSSRCCGGCQHFVTHTWLQGFIRQSLTLKKRCLLDRRVKSAGDITPDSLRTARAVKPQPGKCMTSFILGFSFAQPPCEKPLWHRQLCRLINHRMWRQNRGATKGYQRGLSQQRNDARSSRHGKLFPRVCRVHVTKWLLLPATDETPVVPF